MAHEWILGKTGTGKSTHLLHRVLDVIDKGVIYFDPHGHDIDRLVQFIPKKRRNDVILFDPTDFSIGLNILENVSEENRPFVASAVVDTFKSVWGVARQSG